MNSQCAGKTKHSPGRRSTTQCRRALTVSILLAISLVTAGLLASANRAQNPNCVDLKRRLDDATRAYQTVLAHSQSADKNVASYEAAVTRVRSDLTANDRKIEQTEKDLVVARGDRTRCERNPAVLPAGACANVAQRIANAEKILSYANANQKKLEADLATNQQTLATVRATLAAANANLNSAQQELDVANHAYTNAGCASNRR